MVSNLKKWAYIRNLETKQFVHLSASNPSKIVKIRFCSHLFLSLLKFQEHIAGKVTLMKVQFPIQYITFENRG